MKPIIVTYSNESYIQNNIHWPGVTTRLSIIKEFKYSGWFNCEHLITHVEKQILAKDIKLIARQKHKTPVTNY